MSLKTKLIKIILPLAIVLFGAVVMAALVKSRPAPKKEAKADPGALVRVMEVKKAARRVVVRATGTVQPALSVTVIPQVSGKVESVSPALVSGGFFREGELLFEIEEADYRLAVERAGAALSRAEYELARIESQAKVARSEWERLNNGSNEEPNPLVVYGPQMKDAKGALRSAEAALGQARLDLERTKVGAPFNAIVRSEGVDPGQHMTPASVAAVLAGTDEAEIIVPLPLDELAWVDVPRNGDGHGSPVTVSMEIAGKRHQWKGSVVRSLGEVDPAGRMMRVAVSVPDPYGLSGRGDKPPLAFGSFVEVSIEGRDAGEIVSIPRAALRDGSTVWTVDGGDALRIREVTPLRIEREEVLVAKGLSGGERVVITTLSGAADGMRLRPVAAGERGAL